MKCSTNDAAYPFTWQKKSDTGWTSASFTVSKASDSGKYRCIITDSLGNEVIASSVIVTVVSAANVTVDMVNSLDVLECAEFVNAFSDTDQDLILTEAQLLAVSRVIEADYAAAA